MSASTQSAAPTFGFVRITDLGASTYIGGYLILNALGRPVEFHCTQPVKPNRAQQILYGATLRPFLFGEQMGKSLVEHSQLKPRLLVTDQPSVLALRSFVPIPIVCLSDDDVILDEYAALTLGPNRVILEERFRDDRARIVESYQAGGLDWDLAEPFERIREAITELQKAA